MRPSLPLRQSVEAARSNGSGAMEKETEATATPGVLGGAGFRILREMASEEAEEVVTAIWNDIEPLWKRWVWPSGTGEGRRAEMCC